MTDDLIKVTISTDFGESAQYEIGCYQPKAGMRLMRRLVQVASPIAGLFDTFLQAVVKTEGIDNIGADDEAAQDKAIGELLKNVDTSGFERVLLAFVTGIAREGDADLLIDILKCVTFRSALDSNGNPQRHLPWKQFNVIYKRNYGEVIRACYHCLNHNFGPAIKGFLSGNGLSEHVAGVFAHLTPQPTRGTGHA